MSQSTALGANPATAPKRRSFATDPASLQELERFVRDQISRLDLTPARRRRLTEATSRATGAARQAAEGGRVEIRLRIRADQLEVEVGPARVVRFQDRGGQVTLESDTFAQWMGQVLRREALSQEAAARRIGVSLKTVNRWVRGQTEPRFRELRLIHDAFGSLPSFDVPISV